MMLTDRRVRVSAWRLWLRILLVAIIGNLILRIVAVAILEIPPEFAPLAVAGPTVFLTTVGVLAAAAVWLVIDRVSSQPRPLFRQVAIAALLLSLLPDVWLLTNTGVDSFPGATVPAVTTLMLQHVLAAVVVIPPLTMRG